MATQWLRLWHELPTDPKFRTVARHSKQPITLVLAIYLHMLVNASQADPRGTLFRWCDEDVASALDADEDQVSAVRLAMQGRVLDGDTLMGWERRQPEREESGVRGGKTSTERSRDRRERLKREREEDEALRRNGMQRDATEGNAPDKDTDTDTDKEKSGGDVNRGSATPPPPADIPDYAKAPQIGDSVPGNNRPDEIAALFTRLEADRGLEIFTSGMDRVISTWAANAVSDDMIRAAHAQAVADRTKREGPGKSVNPSFVHVFVEKMRAGPAEKQLHETDGRPWYLIDSLLKAKAAELGYVPPEGFGYFTDQWRGDFLSKHRLVRKPDYVDACNKYGIQE